MKLLRFELYRAFHSRTFFISFFIGIVICFADLIAYYFQFGINNIKQMYLIQAWIGTNYQFAYNMMFYILLPVLACLPYGGSLYMDMKTGYDKNICVKVSRLNYAISKSVAVFLSAVVCVAIPLCLNLFIAAGIFPNFIPERLEGLSIGIMERNLFAEIYSTYPAVHCLIYIAIDSLFAGVIALTSLSLSKVVKSHFTAVVTPMVIYIITAMTMEGYEYGNWSVLGMLNPQQYVVTLWWQMMIAYVVIMIINSLIIWVVSRKRDVL